MTNEKAWQPSQRPIFFPAQQTCLTHQNDPLIAHIPSTLRKHEMNGTMEDYFEAKFGIHPDMFRRITWNSIEKVFKNNKPLRHTMSKIFHRQLNTFSKCYQWRTSTSPLCKLCHKHNGTFQHVLECPQEDMTRVRNKFLSSFNTVHTSLQTEPNLQKMMLHIVQNWNTLGDSHPTILLFSCTILHRMDTLYAGHLIRRMDATSVGSLLQTKMRSSIQ